MTEATQAPLGPEGSQAPKVTQELKASRALQACPSQGRLALLAFLGKEEKKATEDSQACLCLDPVERMGSQALPVFPGPLGSQATQMALWSVSRDLQVTRVPLGPQDSKD